jgi:hypothetical protein
MFRNVLDRLQGRLGLGIALAGFVVMFLGWNGAASNFDTRKQFPYLISGGLTGLGLVIIGAALLIVEAIRAERAEVHALLEELREGTGGRRGASGNGNGDGDLPIVEGLVVAAGSSYHRPGCRLIEGRPGLDTMEAEAAEMLGLTPCRVCDPVPVA